MAQKKAKRKSTRGKSKNYKVTDNVGDGKKRSDLLLKQTRVMGYSISGSVVGVISLIATLFGIGLTVLFFHTGPSAEKQIQALTKQGEALQILRNMQKVQFNKSESLKRLFPLGYIVFTGTDREEVIPLHGPWDKAIKVDWQSDKVKMKMTEERVEITMPDFSIKAPNGGESKFYGSTFSMPKREGGAMSMRMKNLRTVFMVLQIRPSDAIIAMGLQEAKD